ncbi:protein FAM185A [Drosophila kikkawai]|uniref:Protein FAM185A n=1 Tax=Drosophila kikkawai TaxID=30033 RepID=A0A6P4IQW6_DROKI|nr:protein FAM185A [Drosophila kikkawai]XP_017024884.1 protein FAM185A [Drosophila kikkawai]
MQLLQRLCTHIYKHQRHYVKKLRVDLKPNMSSNKRMVHQEILHYVNPFARIDVKSDIFVRVQPADVHRYTSGDVFIAQLCGGPVKNSNVTLDVKVSDDNKEVSVVVKKLTDQPSSFECILQVPVRSDVCTAGKANVRVEGIQSELLQVKAEGGILTKNVKATNISLYSENGNIICQGTLLGKITEIETHNGNISMDKLQGDSLTASTKSGSIVTDCCYVEESKFETATGRLDLKNVHKTSQVHVHDSADLSMTGVHGNLQVVTKGGSLNIQLSELVGHNKIDAQNLTDEAVIYISQTIEQDLNIDVGASNISLDTELEHLTHALSEDKSRFLLRNENNHKLMVSSQGQKGVRLGKQSWSDMMRQKLQNASNESTPSS